MTEPSLWECVTKFLTHGPCGPAKPNMLCTKDGVCRFGYRKEFSAKTIIKENSYPQYYRPRHGPTFTKNGVTFDSRDVVPHSPACTVLLDCHVNVEVVSFVGICKYLHKYIFKVRISPLKHFNFQRTGKMDLIAGPRRRRRHGTRAHRAGGRAVGGRAAFGGAFGAAAARRDQGAPTTVSNAQAFHTGRYVGSCQAYDRITSVATHGIWPPVQRLEVHRPDTKLVTFNVHPCH